MELLGLLGVYDDRSTGRPVALLGRENGPLLAVLLSTHEATAITAAITARRHPSAAVTGPPPVHQVIAAAVTVLGGEISGILVDGLSGGALRSSVVLSGPRGSSVVPASAADSVALAALLDLPVAVSDRVLSDRPSPPSPPSSPPSPPDPIEGDGR